MLKIRRAADLLNEFGIKVMIIKILQTCTRKIYGIKYLTSKLKYHVITEFLYKENKTLIEAFNKSEHHQALMIGSESNVWVLWWQGLEQAPDIVRICIESIKCHIGNRKLIILSKNNYVDYVELDNQYIEMLNQEKITKTQFSDLLRLNLLFQQGGIWLYITYLLTGDLPEYVSKLSFFTIRHGMEKEYPMSKGLWSSSALGFGKGNEKLKLFIDMYNAYFSKHEKLIDYLLTDYIFAVCCDYCQEIKKMFMSVPINNQNVNKLLCIMNKDYDEQLITCMLNGTTMNKLNRRYSFKSMTKNKSNKFIDKRTIYGYFQDMYLGR